MSNANTGLIGKKRCPMAQLRIELAAKEEIKVDDNQKDRGRRAYI